MKSYINPQNTIYLLIGISVTADAFVSDRPYRRTRNHVINSEYLGRPSLMINVVANVPMEKEDEKQSKRSNKDWIPTRGGFIPNMKAKLGNRANTKKKIIQVKDIQEYKKEVADVKDQRVCVRFYAPWCRACKAVESSFRRLPSEFPDVKFVECPVTKENAYLHQGLGVPSLPFAHLYDPSVGLVEERKINKNVFGEFKNILETYVDGECPVTYDLEGGRNYF